MAHQNRNQQPKYNIKIWKMMQQMSSNSGSEIVYSHFTSCQNPVRITQSHGGFNYSALPRAIRVLKSVKN